MTRNHLPFRAHLSMAKRRFDGYERSDSSDDEIVLTQEPKVELKPSTLPDRCFWYLNRKMLYLDSFAIKKNNPQVLGLILMAGAGFFLTIGNVVVQYIHKISEHDVSSYQILFIRSVVQLLLTLIFIFYGRVHPYGSEVRNLFSLVLMGICESAAIIFVYLALEHMPVADATVIQFTAPVFTLAFSFLCLRRGCSVYDACCGALSFIGVVVMTRPSILFHSNGRHTHGIILHGHKGKIGIHPGDPGYYIGAGFALLAAIMLSAFFILNKMTGKKLDLTLTILYPSIFGVVLGPVCQAAFHQPLFLMNDTKVWSLLFLVGFVSFVGMMFMAESLQLEDAGPAVLIRNLDAVYAFTLQYLLLHIAPHWMSLVGAGLVLLATSLIGLQRTIFSKYDVCACKKKEKEEETENKFLLHAGESD